MASPAAASENRWQPETVTNGTVQANGTVSVAATVTVPDSSDTSLALAGCPEGYPFVPPACNATAAEVIGVPYDVLSVVCGVICIISAGVVGVAWIERLRRDDFRFIVSDSHPRPALLTLCLACAFGGAWYSAAPAALRGYVSIASYRAVSYALFVSIGAYTAKALRHVSYLVEGAISWEDDHSHHRMLTSVDAVARHSWAGPQRNFQWLANTLSRSSSCGGRPGGGSNSTVAATPFGSLKGRALVSFIGVAVMNVLQEEMVAYYYLFASVKEAISMWFMASVILSPTIRIRRRAKVLLTWIDSRPASAVSAVSDEHRVLAKSSIQTYRICIALSGAVCCYNGYWATSGVSDFVSGHRPTARPPPVTSIGSHVTVLAVGVVALVLATTHNEWKHMPRMPASALRCAAVLGKAAAQRVCSQSGERRPVGDPILRSLSAYGVGLAVSVPAAALWLTTGSPETWWYGMPLPVLVSLGVSLGLVAGLCALLPAASWGRDHEAIAVARTWRHMNNLSQRQRFIDTIRTWVPVLLEAYLVASLGLQSRFKWGDAVSILAFGYDLDVFIPEFISIRASTAVVVALGYAVNMAANLMLRAIRVPRTLTICIEMFNKVLMDLFAMNAASALLGGLSSCPAGAGDDTNLSLQHRAVPCPDPALQRKRTLLIGMVLGFVVCGFGMQFQGFVIQHESVVVKPSVYYVPSSRIIVDAVKMTMVFVTLALPEQHAAISAAINTGLCMVLMAQQYRLQPALGATRARHINDARAVAFSLAMWVNVCAFVASLSSTDSAAVTMLLAGAVPVAIVAWLLNDRRARLPEFDRSRDLATVTSGHDIASATALAARFIAVREFRELIRLGIANPSLMAGTGERGLDVLDAVSKYLGARRLVRKDGFVQLIVSHGVKIDSHRTVAVLASLPSSSEAMRRAMMDAKVPSCVLDVLRCALLSAATGRQQVASSNNGRGEAAATASPTDVPQRHVNTGPGSPAHDAADTLAITTSVCANGASVLLASRLPRQQAVVQVIAVNAAGDIVVLDDMALEGLFPSHPPLGVAVDADRSRRDLADATPGASPVAVDISVAPAGAAWNLPGAIATEPNDSDHEEPRSASEVHSSSSSPNRNQSAIGTGSRRSSRSGGRVRKWMSFISNARSAAEHVGGRFLSSSGHSGVDLDGEQRIDFQLVQAPHLLRVHAHVLVLLDAHDTDEYADRVFGILRNPPPWLQPCDTVGNDGTSTQPPPTVHVVASCAHEVGSDLMLLDVEANLDRGATSETEPGSAAASESSLEVRALDFPLLSRMARRVGGGMDKPRSRMAIARRKLAAIGAFANRMNKRVRRTSVAQPSTGADAAGSVHHDRGIGASITAKVGGLVVVLVGVPRSALHGSSSSPERQSVAPQVPIAGLDRDGQGAPTGAVGDKSSAERVELALVRAVRKVI